LHGRIIQSQRITRVHRITANIGVEIDPAVRANRISLREDAEVRQIDPRLVVVSADLAQPLLAGVLEPALVRRAGLAVLVVGVDADQRA
jgi:hypothetical protein